MVRGMATRGVRNRLGVHVVAMMAMVNRGGWQSIRGSHSLAVLL